MNAIAKRKLTLTRLRGLLLLVFAAYFYYLHYLDVSQARLLPGIFFFLYAANWVVFMFLPTRHYRKLNLLYVSFLLDTAFIVAGIYAMRVAGLSFYVAVFLLILVSAVARSFVHALVIGTIGCLAYAAFVQKISFSTAVFSGSEYLSLPFLFLTALFASHLAAESEHEQRRQEAEKARVLQAFTTYVPASVVDQAMSRGKVELGGTREQISVLFADLRNFTTASESLEPEETVALLNDFFQGMSRLILEHGGTLDKFIGDAVMALFGAPQRQSDHAARAAAAAIAMDQLGRELAKGWRKEGLENLDVGIGVYTGEATVGNVGTPEHMEYTAIGDTVNTCSRITGLTHLYRVRVIIGEDTCKAIRGKATTRELDLIRVKGKKKAVRIYELVGDLHSDKAYFGTIEKHEKGLGLYREQKWEQAIKVFEDILETDPDDGPSIVLRDRCLTLKADPPGPKWDGVFESKSK